MLDGEHRSGQRLGVRTGQLKKTKTQPSLELSSHGIPRLKQQKATKGGQRHSKKPERNIFNSYRKETMKKSLNCCSASPDWDYYLSLVRHYLESKGCCRLFRVRRHFACVESVFVH